ncbi:MAG: peptidase M15 [Flavobacteriaceae bacterium]|jgi:zinc D-Ala-D-Ala carboxypeptidase|nr:peptidase M15 [Flavobacteriaceae bacterium]
MTKSKKSNFSKHISWKEAFGSATAKKLDIDNTPTEEALSNMKILADELFEPLREKVGEPILVTSFYRSLELNNNLSGAAATSQHIDGCAIDLDATSISNCELFYIIKNELDFDKLIWELGDDNNPAWIHVSYVKGNNRKLVYQAKRKAGKGYSTYTHFGLDIDYDA